MGDDDGRLMHIGFFYPGLLKLPAREKKVAFISTARCSNRTRLLSRIHPSISPIQSNPLIAFKQSKQFRTVGMRVYEGI